MQFLSLRQALDGADRGTLRLYRKHQTGPHRRTVEQDRAGAAHAMLAPHMRAGQAAILADRVEQSAPRFKPQRVAPPIDGQRDFDWFDHPQALLSAPYTMAATSSRRYRASACWSSSGSIAAAAAVAAFRNTTSPGTSP